MCQRRGTVPRISAIQHGELVVVLINLVEILIVVLAIVVIGHEESDPIPHSSFSFQLQGVVVVAAARPRVEFKSPYWGYGRNID